MLILLLAIVSFVWNKIQNTSRLSKGKILFVPFIVYKCFEWDYWKTIFKLDISIRQFYTSRFWSIDNWIKNTVTISLRFLVVWKALRCHHHYDYLQSTRIRCIVDFNHDTHTFHSYTIISPWYFSKASISIFKVCMFLFLRNGFMYFCFRFFSSDFNEIICRSRLYHLNN